MKSILCWCYLATTLLLAGCSNSDSYSESALAIPLQPSFEQEVMLAKLEQVLAIKELSDDDRAQLLYRRVMLFDSLGLRVLARNDFSQALEIRPDIPEIYNFLGIYYTLEGNFDAAYEAFDSVFELEPTYNYARFNRGMALYYGGRYSLAQDDLLAFYSDDPNDPYRSLWLYFAEREIDAKAAKVALQQRYEKAVKEQWGWNIVEFYLGKISKKALMNSLKMEATDNTSLAEHLSETHFYLGKYYLSLGDVNTAAAMFKLTVANNVYNFVEHRYALLELALLGQRQDDLSESDKE